MRQFPRIMARRSKFIAKILATAMIFKNDCGPAPPSGEPRIGRGDNKQTKYVTKAQLWSIWT